MKETAKLARKHGLRLHTHVAETKDEEKYCAEKFNMRPFELMESIGWVGEDCWYAHSIYVNDEEIKRMARTKTGVAHCPVSNLRLGSGIAPGANLICGIIVPAPCNAPTKASIAPIPFPISVLIDFITRSASLIC